eukprot:ANDGO_03624.mRNA.1 hypothetical protein
MTDNKSSSYPSYFGADHNARSYSQPMRDHDCHPHSMTAHHHASGNVHSATPSSSSAASSSYSTAFTDSDADSTKRVVSYIQPQECGSFNRPIVEEETIMAKNALGETVKVVRITIFCPAASISKEMYFDMWQSIEDTNSFFCHLGNVFFNNERSLVHRLHSYNIMGTAVRTVGPRKIFYFSGHTLNNVLILMEIIVDHSANNAGILHYKIKEDCNDRDVIFESFIQELLRQEHPQLHVVASQYAERMSSIYDYS